MVRFLLVSCAALVLGACVDTAPRPTSTPEWTAKNVKGYVETAAGLPPEKAFGWDLRVEGGVARWRECESAEVCGDVERNRPAGDLLGFTNAGRARLADGREADVLTLSLAARPRYVVPVK